MRYSRNSKHYDALRAWLKAKRIEAGLSIRSMSEELDVSHSILGKIEDGTRKIEVFEFVEMCRVLDTDPMDGIKIIQSTLDKK